MNSWPMWLMRCEGRPNPKSELMNPKFSPAGTAFHRVPDLPKAHGIRETIHFPDTVSKVIHLATRRASRSFVSLVWEFLGHGA
jgi:hypothetical protein